MLNVAKRIGELGDVIIDQVGRGLRVLPVHQHQNIALRRSLISLK